MCWDGIHICIRAQVLGLTNYSHDPNASLLRSCIRTDLESQSLALDFAKDRLREMLHVGVFERLHVSLATLATAVGISIDQTSYKTDTAHAFSYDVSEKSDKVVCHPHWY